MSLTQGMTAKKLLGYYQNKADQDAREAKARGDLVCWSASVAPSEFCVTMGIAMIYPERYRRKKRCYRYAGRCSKKRLQHRLLFLW